MHKDTKNLFWKAYVPQNFIFAVLEQEVGKSPGINTRQSIVSGKDFNLILRVLKDNWWVPVAILPIFYGISLFAAYRVTTVYKAISEFQIKADDAYYKGNVLSDEMFYSASYMDNSNETRVLQSYDLSSKVVEKLIEKIQVSYFIVGKVRTTEQFASMPFKISVLSINPTFYEKLFDFKIISASAYEITYMHEGSKVTKKGNFNQDLVDTDWRLNIVWQNEFSPSTIQVLKEVYYQFAIHSKENLISNIRNNISVDNPDFTQILHIELLDVIPERAILILDTLNAVYSANKLKSKYELNERTINYIDRQISEISNSLKTIEDTMQSYKEDRDIIDLNWEQEDFLNKIGKYDGERSQLQLQQRALNDLEAYIIEDKDSPFLPPTVFIFERTGFLAKATEDLYTKQIELSNTYSRVREDNPVVIELKNSIQKLKSDLLTYIGNTRKATSQQIENVNREIDQYVKEARRIPGKQRDILNIQRKASVSEQLYSFLLEKRASTRIARASIVSDVKIIEAPRNGGIAYPDKGKIQKQVLGAGLAMVLIVILIRSFFFTKIKSVDYLRELTDLQLIGVLPQVKEGKADKVIVEEEPNSAIAEAFRSFRTNLQFLNVDKESKTFLISSFLPGEGKTFTGVNLASILARGGRKTLIIELDLHKPRVYKCFGLEAPEKGLTTCISGTHSFSEIISTTFVPNLYAIFAGPIPPNPSEFVLSEKMKEIIIKAKSEFDYVIIDSPPAGLLSDAIYLMQYVDASIFVLNTRTTTKKAINFIEEVVQVNNLKNVMLLLNGVQNRRSRYYYAGYGYGYNYSYGYSGLRPNV